ncbi:MAG: glycosyltransferase family 4 protein [Candidatus Aenigmatarchaeota archaeon]
MKILLVSPEFLIKETKGLARYGYEIYSRINKIYDVEVVFRKKFHMGFLGFVFSLLYSNILVLIKGRKFNVIHALSPELAILAAIFYRKKLVVTFHDLFPIIYWKKLRYKIGILTSFLSFIVWKIASRAKIIVAVSSLTKQQIEKKLKRTNVRIILEGVDEKIKQKKPKNKYLTLCSVGGYSYRKRVDIAIKLFEIIRKKEKDCKLIIVGGRKKSIYESNFSVPTDLNKDIILLEKASDEKLIDVYSESHFIIISSVVEGFCLPIIEALKCNTIPITFEFSEIPKETKELCIVCKDVRDACEKIIDFWKNNYKMWQFLKKVNKKIKKFDWNKTVKEYIKLYKEIANYGES